MDSLTPLVATRVLAAIESKGATQLGISEATGIPRTTLIRRLNGHTSFTVAELEQIAAHLGMAVHEFLVEAA